MEKEVTVATPFLGFFPPFHISLVVFFSDLLSFAHVILMSSKKKNVMVLQSKLGVNCYSFFLFIEAQAFINFVKKRQHVYYEANAGQKVLKLAWKVDAFPPPAVIW